jgi:hypothetical protein
VLDVAGLRIIVAFLVRAGGAPSSFADTEWCRGVDTALLQRQGRVLVGLAAAALIAGAAPAGAVESRDRGGAGRLEVTLQGQWNFAAINARGATKFTPSAVNPGTSAAEPQDDGILDADTTVTRVGRVAPSGRGALDFPGWNDPARHALPDRV